ncbi:MAG: trypsin-like peptidase domain-containing protein [Vicinamibacterales bacterium]
MIKRFSLISLLFASGLIAGLVLSGRGAVRNDVLALRAPSVAEQSSPPPSAAPPAGAPDFTRVAAQTVKAVTNIASLQRRPQQYSPFANDPFFQYFFGDQADMFGRNRYESSLGSGVVISPSGLVVTNNHVIGEGMAEVTVSIDRRELSATIIGKDPSTDLALLKVDAANLAVIPWGDSSKLRVAEWVMAVGTPFSLSQTVTLGVVSALGRSNMGIAAYEDFIQTDAAINPGNSGGALINSRGELVGINTAIFSQSGGYQGIGFAVPSNLVRRVIDDLTKYGQVRRGSVGYVEVAPLTSRLADELRAPKADGVFVNQLARSSSAYRAGLEPGDVILSINDQPVADPSQFVRLISDSPIGSTARIEVLRDGQRRTLRVPIEAQANRRPRR